MTSKKDSREDYLKEVDNLKKEDDTNNEDNLKNEEDPNNEKTAPKMQTSAAVATYMKEAGGFQPRFRLLEVCIVISRCHIRQG